MNYVNNKGADVKSIVSEVRGHHRFVVLLACDAAKSLSYIWTESVQNVNTDFETGWSRSNNASSQTNATSEQVGSTEFGSLSCIISLPLLKLYVHK